MSATENRIVKMIFDNASFKKGAVDTQTQLSNLDKAVTNAGNNKGLLSMSGAMQTVAIKASAMQVAVGAAIATISAKATAAGLNLAKSLTIEPLMQGFQEYELKMKSIQTILANTSGENLKTVTLALNELNEYSDKTIYNFANMTENIGKLTTAGISLEDATATVKGFSNMVALAGGDATAAAGAMEQFGQGLQAGAIKAIDWMSISNRGLGSQSLQKAFFETARAAGALTEVPITTSFEDWAKAQGGFKASLESGWLTTETATETLKIMTGDIKNAQELVAMGFSPKAAEDMLQIAENALDSATKVRTFTAFMGTLREQIGSGWSQVIEVVLGDFNESTKLFTRLSDITGKVIGKTFGYIERLAKGWEEMGGRAAILTTIQHILSPIAATLGLIAKVWKEVFGGTKTGKGLATFSKGLEHATRPLEVLGKLIRGSHGPVTALVRLFQIAAHAVRNLGEWIAGYLPDVTKFVDLGKGGGGFLDFIKDVGREIGRAIEKIESMLSKGASLTKAFGSVDISLPNMPKLPDMPSMPSLPSIGSIFGGVGDQTDQITGLAAGIDSLTGSMSGLALAEKKEGGLFNPDAQLDTGRITDLADEVKTAAGELTESSGKMETVGDKLGGFFSTLKDRLTEFLGGLTFEDLTASFNLAVLSTMVISISRFLNTLSKSFEGFVGTGEAVNEILGQAGNALGSFQTAARAKLLIAIAIAIGVLAASLWLLSRIPLDKLATGLAGLTGIMLIMKVGVDSISKAVDNMEGKGTPLKLAGLSFALMALGAAVLMLAGAFLILEKVDWMAMLKGLGTIVVVMTMMERLGKIGEHGAKNLMGSAVALMALAGSMVVLAGALLLFKLVDWGSMAKAGVSLAAMTIAIGALALIPYDGIAKVGLAMLAASVGMLAIANALLLFQFVKWESIGKAAVMLLALTASMAALMAVGGPVAAGGILALSAAMVMLATAGLLLNNVDWESIGKIAVILGVIVLAAAAFLAVMAAFSPVLILLSGFAGSIALLALALTGLALAFAVIFPLLAAGAGVFAAFATGAAVAFAVFVTTLAAEAPIIKKAFLNILQVIIDGIVEAVPMVIDGIKRLFAAVKEQFSGGEGNKMKGLMGKESKSWIEKLKDGIAERIPMLVDKAKELILKFIDGLVRHSKTIGQKGAELVVGLIEGISSRIGKITDAAVELIIEFAEGIGNGLDRITKAGIKLIADFLHNLADNIRAGSAAIGAGITDVVDAMKDVGMDMVQGLIDGVQAMIGDALSVISDLAADMVREAKSAFEIFSPSRVFKNIGKFLVEGLTIGIQANAASAITAVASMVGGQIAMASGLISNFVNKLDQQALAASAKATGLTAAAETASKAADRAAAKAAKTKKNKADDRKANKLETRAEKLAEQANKATRKAEQKEETAEKARLAAERKEQFAEASTLDKAKMRSEDAQTAIEEAREAEFKAARNLAQADALDQAAKGPGLTKKERKEMRAEADRLRKGAEAQAQAANARLAAARTLAGEALALQKQAGDEAATLFQQQFDAEAQADADEAAFNKMTDAEKAAKRREQATALQAKANEDLAKAKQLAYTDLEAANELAAQAMDQADLARQYIQDALSFEEAVAQAAAQGTGQATVDTGGTVVNLDPTEAAALAFARYADIYDSATAAESAGATIEFNQYNSSPEALNPVEVYRQTNNLFTHAVQRLEPSAA